MDLFNSIYKGRKVFLTGHTGFKGSWLSLWLHRMGAEVTGYSLEAPSEPSHWNLLQLPVKSVIGDIRDASSLEKAMTEAQPDFVFHLAAQPLVRLSYSDPVGTYSTNVMGTLNVLEACRRTKSVKAIVVITTDKCYENKEWVWGYRENDPMGGYDPYSSSKGCAELLVASYRNSYFNIKEYNQKHSVLLASARAGNVIGGGDWADDRLVPDIMKSTAKNETVVIRSPNATRPWQQVLEPLSGYLMLGQKLLEGKAEFAEGWNFGPTDEGNLSVMQVLTSMQKHWNAIQFKVDAKAADLHEANLLKLDCSKAHAKLGWKAQWSNEMTFERTAKWYKEFYTNGKCCSGEDLDLYVAQSLTTKEL
jgi:CDP-glucose 4,6-dehydratase